MTPEEMVAVIAKTEANAEEIKRLRERSHEYGNELQKAIVGIENLGAHLEANHTSMLGRLAELRADVKEDFTDLKTAHGKDLSDIKTQTTKTNGHVADVDRRTSRLQGAFAAFAFVVTVGTPVALFLAPHIH